MNEHPPELSKLPEDPASWERLEGRILESLHAPVPPIEEESEWWAPLAARAYALGAAALAAGIAAALLLPTPSHSASSAAGKLFQPPAEDPGLISPFAADVPPSIGQLLLPVARRDR